MNGPGQQEPYQLGCQLKRSSMFEYLSQNESRLRHFDDETLSILPETKIISTPAVAMADQNCSPWPPAGPQSWPMTNEIIFIWGALHRRSGPSLTLCLTMGGKPLSQHHRQDPIAMSAKPDNHYLPRKRPGHERRQSPYGSRKGLQGSGGTCLLKSKVHLNACS